MPVSDRDKAHFAKLGSIKQALHDEAAADHLRGTIDDRMERSWALYLAHRDSVDTSQRDDDPSAFYERARRLGLYLE